MNIDFLEYENFLFDYVKRIKNFNGLLIKKYNLTDIPYNVSGKAFPKIGQIEDEYNKIIPYRFHGRGATFYEDQIEVYFATDASSKYQIIVSVGGLYCFFKTYLDNYDDNFPVELLMEEFEKKGIFIQRKLSDLGTFHVNEKWYDLKLKGLEFKGEGKDDIDWN